MRSTTWSRLAVLLAALALGASACGNAPDDAGGDAADGGSATDVDAGGAPSGSIEVDGSSTVAPLTEAVAEVYAEEQADVRVNVGTSGTGGGFERFCSGETDISDASRPIAEEEDAACAAAGVEYTELRVGTDALTIVVSPENDWATCLTVDQLVKIFGADDPATSWDQVDPAFPSEQLQVFAPGADSGTYDFFLETLEIDEEPGARQDYNASEDDNIIVEGVRGTRGGWGFFGFAYFQENAEGLKALEVDGGDGCVAPGEGTAKDGSYLLTRPLYIYVNNEALGRAEVADFVTFYLETIGSVIGDVGYIAEDEADLEEAHSALEAAISG